MIALTGKEGLVLNEDLLPEILRITFLRLQDEGCKTCCLQIVLRVRYLNQ